jgi:hypothetical protein
MATGPKLFACWEDAASHALVGIICAAITAWLCLSGVL